MTWPFENDTSAIVKKLASRSIKADKRRNVFIIVTIAFAVCLMTILALYNTANQAKWKEEERDHYQAAIVGADEQVLEQIRNDVQIEKSGLSLQLSSFRSGESTVTVLYEDQGNMELLREPALDGKLPEKENEIALERSYLQMLGLPATVGQTITLDLGNGEADYIVSGVFGDNNSSKAYNIVTSKAYAEKVSQAAPGYELKVRLADFDNMDMQLLKSEILALAVKYGASENQVFFSSNYFAMIEDGGSSSALIIAALFIVIACGIVIYSLFYISVIGKTKEYGRLKVLGTTPRQIKRIVRKESYSLSLVSIPIGLIIGSIIAFALMPGYWNWIVNVPYMVGIIIITEVMILVSTHAPVKLAGKVSAIEAVRITAMSTDNQKSVSKTLHRKITPAGLARMNFVRHRKKTLLTMVSLGFTGVLLMCIASYSNSIDYISMARQSFPNGEYELSLNGDATPEDMAVLQSENPMNDELFRVIANIPGTTNIEVYQQGRLTIPNAEGITVIGLTDAQMENFIDALTDGTMEYAEMISNNGIIIADKDNLLEHFFQLPENIGDTFPLEMLDDTVREFTIVGRADENKFGTVGIIMPDVLLDELMPEIENNNFRCVIQTDGSNPDYRNQLYTEVTNPEISILSFQDYADQVKQMLAPIIKAMYAIMIFVFLFALLNLVNTLMTNLISRQQEFGILQSVGLSNKQLSKMLSVECLCYVVGTMLTTLVIGSLCGVILCKIFNTVGTFGTLKYQFPVMEIFLFFIALLLLQVTFSMIAVRYSKQQSLVERIKNNGLIQLIQQGQILDENA